MKFSLWAILGMTLATTAYAADLSDARNTVDAIRENDPPVVSTDTKPSPVGQPVSDYKPEGPSPTTAEPPSPVNRLNPQNDPDVQRGLDSYRQPGS